MPPRRQPLVAALLCLLASASPGGALLPAAGQPAAPEAETASADRVERSKEYVTAVAAFCASLDFGARKCELASQAEEDASAIHGAVCAYCGTLYQGPDYPPYTLKTHPNYDQAFVRVLSLACRGAAVARTVFKTTGVSPSWIWGENKSGCVKLTGANLTRSSIEEFSAVKRCEVVLPPGRADEAAAAAEATQQINCVECSSCTVPDAPGGICPHKLNTWYSDTFTVDVPDQCPPRPGAVPLMLGLLAEPGVVAQVAVLELHSKP